MESEAPYLPVSRTRDGEPPSGARPLPGAFYFVCFTLKTENFSPKPGHVNHTAQGSSTGREVTCHLSTWEVEAGGSPGV